MLEASGSLGARCLRAAVEGRPTRLLTVAPSGRRALLSCPDAGLLELRCPPPDAHAVPVPVPGIRDLEAVTGAGFLADEREALVTTRHPEILRLQLGTGVVAARRTSLEAVVAAVAVHPEEPWAAILVAQIHGVGARIRVFDVGTALERGVEAGTLADWPLDPDDRASPEERTRLAWWEDDAVVAMSADGVPSLWGTDGIRRWMAPPRHGGPAVACVADGAGLAVVRRDGVLDRHPTPLRQVPDRSVELPGAPLRDAIPAPDGSGILLIGGDGRVHEIEGGGADARRVAGSA